jgi:hypothetical protein
VTVTDHAQEDFVDEIFRQRLPARHSIEEPEKRAMAVLIDFSHTGKVAARDRRHAFVVAALIRGVHPYTQEN